MVKKQSSKKPSSRSKKVTDFEPNKMTFAVSMLAVISLLLLSIIATS